MMNLLTYSSIALAGMAWLSHARPGLAKEAASGKEIRVALYADSGATRKDLPEVELCLLPSMGFDVEHVTAADVRSGELAEFDVLIHPGGSASEQARTLGEDGRERLRRFVKDGGGFVGICAGAYLASAQYRWSLGILNAAVVDDEHWERGIGKVQLRLPSAGRAALDLDQEIIPIHYNNGPLLAPGNEKQLAGYELLAAYESEIAENGAPTGIMKGTTAIARGEFGKGRVICFSPHPEKTRGGDSVVRAAVRWAAHFDQR
jgi:glutamine amidotransferase-like uncharacterized protein